MINEELNKLSVWVDTKCIICKRGYPDTIINIEGIIHHSCKPVCLNIKNCNKYVRNTNRNTKRLR